MTQDEIIELAKQCGLLDEVNGWDVWFPDELEAFAKLVAEKEREACAKLCEETVCKAQDSWDRGVNTACTELARAIRARGGNANTM